MAFILALEPFTHLQPISLHLRPIILSQAVFPLARLLADCDAELRRSGVLAAQQAASLQLSIGGAKGWGASGRRPCFDSNPTRRTLYWYLSNRRSQK